MSNPLDAVIVAIVARLEQGVPPWRQPWSNGALPGRPLRSNGEPFTGSNAILLAMSGGAQGFGSRYWFTFQQALGVGACVRRGSKASPAILYKTRVVEADEAAGEDGKVLKYMRSYHVFNGDQIDNLPEQFGPTPAVDPERRAAAQDAVLDAIPADVRLGGAQAFYTRAGDYIRLPPPEAFETVDDFRSTKAHELGHWSGAKHRLDREFGQRFGDQAYAFEELVAEGISLLLGLEIGVRPQMIDSHAAYIGHWAKLIKDRPGALMEAFGHAQRATDFLAAFSRSPDTGAAPVAEAPTEAEPAQLEAA